MSTNEMRDLLQSLPPAMDDPIDRFDMVRRRARRRARGMAVAASAVVAAGAIVGTAVITSTSPSTQSGSDFVATEPPPSPTDTVLYDDAGPLPGEMTVIDLSDPVEVTLTGAHVVDLGPRPDGATAANVSVVCMSAGRIVYPDGASMVCEAPASSSQVADPRSSNYAVVDLEPDQTSLRFQADDGVQWKLVATYVRTKTSDWGINAKGETFGVQRDGRSPDLIAVYTTEGKQGYAYTKDLRGPVPTSPAEAAAQQQAIDGPSHSVPVYESDGETVVGDFRIAD